MPRLLLCLLLLTACTAHRSAAPSWRDPAAQAEAERVICALGVDCRDLRVELLDSAQPLAEIRFGYLVVVTRGLWQRSHDAEERRFVLAHEVAHRELGHPRPRSVAERRRQELAADGWAAARLCERGHSPLPGRALLQRLHDEVAAQQADGRVALRQTALEEYRQRIALLRECA